MTISFMAFVLSVGAFVITSFVFLFKLDKNYDSEADKRTLRLIEIVLHVAIAVAGISVLSLILLLIKLF